MTTLSDSHSIDDHAALPVAATDPLNDGLLRDLALDVIKTTPDLVFVASPTGRVEFMNIAARNVLGVGEGEAVTAGHLADWLPISQGASFQEALSRAREEGSWTGEISLLRRDATVVAVAATILVRRGKRGDVEAISLIARDITEQLRNLRRLQTRALAIEAVSDGIVVTAPWRRDNPIVYVNQAFERLSGYRAHDVLGHNWRILIGERSDKATFDLIQNAVGEQRPCKCELLMYRADGSKFLAALSLTFLRDEHSSMLYSVLMMTDISHQRQLEEHLRQSQKMESIGRLAGGIAHDFNNLLTVILGSAQRASKLLAGNAQRVAECVDDIHDAAERAAALTRQLLAFSRKQVVVPQTIEVNALIQHCSNLVRKMIGEEVALQMALAAEEAFVLADQTQLEQVLLNLAVNARDAMPDGGTLTIETGIIELNDAYLATHSDSRPGPLVRIVVSDTGLGMSPDIASQAFEPFFTTKRPGEGTGMGLATVFGIVKQNEGHITLKSEPGLGTSFCIDLPRASQPPRAADAHQTGYECPRGTETILIVEDEPQILRLASQYLSECGYHVLSAENGTRACELVRLHEGSIDLSVVDVVMPGMNGPDLAERVLELRPGMEILYVSGYMDNLVLRRDIQSRNVNFLPKPYDQRSLGEKVRQILDGRPSKLARPLSR